MLIIQVIHSCSRGFEKQKKAKSSRHDHSKEELWGVSTSPLVLRDAGCAAGSSSRAGFGSLSSSVEFPLEEKPSLREEKPQPCPCHTELAGEAKCSH